MKKFLTPILLAILFVGVHNQIYAQSTSGRPDKFYTMSGIGFSFPVGETADYLKPKFSSTLGLNIGLGQGGLFLYPKVSLHSYRYDELNPEPGYYALQKGRSTTYLLNVALGYRVFTGKFSFYGFAGGGGGIILTPQLTANSTTLQAELTNKRNNMGMIEAGVGTELNLGNFIMFAEGSYMHGFNKIQDRNFASVPLVVGIKPNLSKLFSKK